MSEVLTPAAGTAERFDNTTTVRNLCRQTGILNLMAMAGVTEVAVNRPLEAWTETRDGWQRHAMPELTYDLCKKLARTLAILNKKQGFGPEMPMVPSKFPDGERGQLNIEPSVEPGTVSFTVRIPSDTRYKMDDYIGWGTFNHFRATAGYTEAPANIPLEDSERDMLRALHERDIPKFIRLIVAHQMNIVFVGGTGSGKTTLMKMIADQVPADTRIGTIEDTHELSLPNHPNHVHLFYSDTWPAKEVVKATLRMKFDRVYLAELRGDETWDYLTLLNTGHQGGMTSVHANNSRAAYPRIATLIKSSEVGKNLDYDYVLREVKQTVDVVFFMNKRKQLTEIYYDPVQKWKLQQVGGAV
jgi:type IV secretion system protein VirB11